MLHDVLTVDALTQALQVIRPAVRQGKPYSVGAPPEAPIKLNQNENPFELPEAVKRELLEALQEVPLNRYPAEHPERLRQALAEHLGWSPEGIIVGNGSNELTFTLGLAVVDAGTPVVLPRPMFSFYEMMVRLHGGNVLGVPPRPDLQFDTEALLETISRNRPALVVLTTPNNPTGLTMAPEDVEAIVQAAPGLVLIDEAYVEFTDGIGFRRFLDHYPHVLLLRTFSKAFGLAGVRLGYLVGHPRIIQELYKARIPFMVDRLAETIALTLLRHYKLVQEQAARIKQAVAWLYQELATLAGVAPVPSQANFVIFRTELQPRILLARLAQKGILLRDLSNYPELRGYVRVSAGRPEENRAFMDALKEALTEPE
ncbi:histidinol-phosphate transaminase [Rhodothermus bifroesti]|jgi:histidinol-phosphate aminotransferase|uniref:Histidinol-phosphate aminotransferase n=1 Tax=Rhodothermus marinus TaxID=29549 RepID=A0A7V2AZU0_RHOMR|nr:histidinol-phosphate transaminase [Rhodothermus bifroesti]GBD01480.1 Histidinol-phosphate aminotransferase 2 [bacterium HR18]